jgi:translation initiation factor IF-2
VLNCYRNGSRDHGKTSLLDYIREENVSTGESGDTQHIGVLMVLIGVKVVKNCPDTPGLAFTICVHVVDY